MVVRAANPVKDPAAKPSSHPFKGSPPPDQPPPTKTSPSSLVSLLLDQVMTYENGMMIMKTKLGKGLGRLADFPDS